MAFITRFEAKHCDWTGDYDTTYVKASNFCGSIPSCGGWVSASPVDGMHGSNLYAYPTISVGNDFVLHIPGDGGSSIYKYGVRVGGINSMSGDCNELVIVWDDWFCHFLIHGCYGGIKSRASISMCCMNIGSEHYSGFLECTHYSDTFNSINAIPFYNNSNDIYYMSRIFNYNVDSSTIDVDRQPIFKIYTSDPIYTDFVTCPNLPLSGAWDHQIIKFEGKEYYAVGGNTLIRVKRS